MIIVKIGGGLGNQMFQYAAAKSLSIKLNTDLELDLSWYKNNRLHNSFELKEIFDIQEKIAEFKSIKRNLGIQFPLYILGNKLFSKKIKFLSCGHIALEPYFHYWKGINKINRNSLLVGYFQSELYFQEFKRKIREIYNFRGFSDDRNINLANKLKTEASVAIHIRRGDYLKNSSSGLGICPISYYRDAIDIIKRKIDNPVFCFFSNEPEWVKENLNISKSSVFVDWNKGKNSYLDMQLMTFCKNHIIANSSFSWWGAWLATSESKIVISPKPWFNNKCFNDKDIIPEEWFRISR